MRKSISVHGVPRDQLDETLDRLERHARGEEPIDAGPPVRINQIVPDETLELAEGPDVLEPPRPEWLPAPEGEETPAVATATPAAVSPTIETYSSADVQPSEDAKPLPASMPAVVHRDYMPVVAKARQEADSLRDVSMISRLGTMANAAFRPGSKPNAAVADQLGEDANRVEKRADYDIALDRMNVEARRKSDLNDPNSAANRAAQDAFIRAMPVAAKGLTDPVIRRMTKEQLDKFMGVNHDRATEQHAVEALDETKRHNRATEGLGDARLELGDSIGGRHINNALIGMGNKVANVAPIIQTLQRIESVAPGYTRGLVPPGAATSDWERFKTKARVGKRFTSEQALALQQGVAFLAQEVRHGMYGAALSPYEREDFSKIFDDSLRAGPEVQAIAVDLFRQNTGAKLRSLQSVFGSRPQFQAPFDAWRAESGDLSYRNPVFENPSNVARTPAENKKRKLSPAEAADLGLE